MNMKTVTADDMRLLEKRMMEEYGVPAQTLIDRAGYGMAAFVRHILNTKKPHERSVLCVAGTGNNGGDAFSAAAYLHEAGVSVSVLLCGDQGKIKGSALKCLNELEQAGIEVEQMDSPSDWTDPENDYIFSMFSVIVDGLLGTGFNGQVREPVVSAINFINKMARRAIVVSLDVPSGINSDTGTTDGTVVCADFTLAAGYPKRSFLAPGMASYVGSVRIVDLGLPVHLLESVSDTRCVIVDGNIQEVLRRRAQDSHKGTFGHLLVVAGARGFSGAAAMAALSALRTGAGLVSVITPESVSVQVASAVPQAMVHPVKENRNGSMSYSGFKSWKTRLNDFDAVLAGPGLTNSSDTYDIIKSIIDVSEIPVLLDADGLNALDGKTDLLGRAKGPLVVTPHPGEMARLTGRSIVEVQADRQRFAGELADKTGAVVVLKGAGTVVAAKDRPVSLCLCGNPGMATAGSGDVLSGVISSLLAQGQDPFDSARAGVQLHGLAGDLAALSLSQAGATAMDISAALPTVIGTVCGR